MASTLPNDPNTERVYEIAQDWIEQHEAPCLANIVPFATNLMSAAQKIITDRGRGSYKARIVMTVARKIVRDVEYESDADRQAAIDLVENVLPGALTAIKIASTALAGFTASSGGDVQPRCCC